MNKNFLISNPRLLQIISETRSSDYTSEDYLEVFFLYFRPWIKEKYGEKVANYPMSYLLQKNLDEFCQEMGLDEPGYYSGGALLKVGKQLVEKGKHQLPFLGSETLFTQKYKRHLESFLDELQIPNFAEVIFREDSPYDLKLFVKIDYPKYMKSQTQNRFNPTKLTYDIEEYIKNYLGVDIGPVSHGKLNLDILKPELLNVEDWVKNNLNAVIKKEIKKIPEAKTRIHSIRFKPDEKYGVAEIKLVFKDGYYGGKYELKKKIREVIDALGYNTHHYKLED